MQDLGHYQRMGDGKVVAGEGDEDVGGVGEEGDGVVCDDDVGDRDMNADDVLAKLPTGIFTLRARIAQVIHILTTSTPPVNAAASRVVAARDRLVMQIIRDGGTGMKYAELDAAILDLRKALHGNNNEGGGKFGASADAEIK